MDRKIVEYLVMGKPHRWIKEQLGVGAGRLAKVQALAEAHGYLSGQAMPAYPQALFADRMDRRSEQRSATDAALLARKEWIEERLRAGWKAITVFEELRSPSRDRASIGSWSGMSWIDCRATRAWYGWCRRLCIVRARR